MRLLLISNSTNAGEAYLAYPMPRIGEFLRGVREVAFVPYAAVTFSYADYERRVQARFSELGIRVRSVHRAADPAAMIRRAEAICVGGGNTFALAKKMQEHGLMRAIRNRVKAGVPYVGWSAGSNVACPAISTTNDMPIVEPESFRAVGAVKFQINPHYLDANPEGHAGETREVRLLEFVAANPRRYAVGLREGCMLRYENGRLELLGSRPMRIFKKGLTPYELKNAYSSDRIVCFRPRDPAFEEALRRADRHFSYDGEHEAYRIDIESGGDAKEVLRAFGTYIEDFEIRKGDMDDVFLNVTGKNIALSGGENG